MSHLTRNTYVLCAVADEDNEIKIKKRVNRTRFNTIQNSVWDVTLKLHLLYFNINFFTVKTCGRFHNDAYRLSDSAIAAYDHTHVGWSNR